MRAWLTYARLLLPWWLFRATRPSETARLDWGYVRWGRTEGVHRARPQRPVYDIEHLCRPGLCFCVRYRGGVAEAVALGTTS